MTEELNASHITYSTVPGISWYNNNNNWYIDFKKFLFYKYIQKLNIAQITYNCPGPACYQYTS